MSALLGDSASRATRSGTVPVADAALWALVRLNDSRCVPGLLERIGGSPSGFARGSGVHVSRGLPYFPQLPALSELLLEAGDHAEMLLPAVRYQLRRTTDGQLLSRFAEVLAAWGLSATALFPYFGRLLSA
ncbi:hypothetical protein [Streptacidiphilus cavernicola]|uniref:Transcriptional regulator n=1 Tax=Streptacidiphilus cavernicola TaxID=3342716 RepID=A0ABV6VW40_9ACTN